MRDTNELPEWATVEAWRSVGGSIWGHKTSEEDEPLFSRSSIEAAEAELRRLHAECEALRSAAPTAPAAGPQQSIDAWIAEVMAGPPPDHPAWEAGPQQEQPYGFESGLVQLLNEARCLSKETVGNRELASRIVRYMRMRGPRHAPAVERGVADSLERLARSAENLLNTCPDIDDGTTRCVQNLWASIAASRAALTATGAANGHGDMMPFRHHTNAVVGRLAAYLHHKFGDQITAEISEEMLKIAREVNLPRFSPGAAQGDGVTPASPEVAAAVDEALDLVELPPIRIPKGDYALLTRISEATGLGIQAVVRSILKPGEVCHGCIARSAGHTTVDSIQPAATKGTT